METAPPPPDAGTLRLLRLLPVLILLVAAADCLLFSPGGGLGLVVLTLIAALAAQVAAGRPGPATLRLGWPLFLLALLPTIEDFNAIALLFLFLGMGLLAAFITLESAGGRAALARAARLAPILPWRGFLQIPRDMIALALARPTARVKRPGFWALVRGWGPALVLGAVFAWLLLIANPVLDQWFARLRRPDLDIAPIRLIFWAGAAVMFWPLLRLTALGRWTDSQPLREPRIWFEPEAVARALWLFNGLFLIQTGMDLIWLWGGLDLPAGVTHAEYAHRGAYPLVATSLLAGAFAVLAQPSMAGRPDLRWLLLIWLAQNAALLLSAAWRLDLYVTDAGLTRLRFAAAVWMGLVAVGIGLMAFQIVTHRPARWMVSRAFAIALATLWFCSFINVDRLVARDNLARFGERADWFYLCGLGDDAAPVLAAWPGSAGHCADYFYDDMLAVYPPADWREWGFRNMRLRHSLNAMSAPAVQPAPPPPEPPEEPEE